MEVLGYRYRSSTGKMNFAQFVLLLFASGTGARDFSDSLEISVLEALGTLLLLSLCNANGKVDSR